MVPKTFYEDQLFNLSRYV